MCTQKSTWKIRGKNFRESKWWKKTKKKNYKFNFKKSLSPLSFSLGIKICFQLDSDAHDRANFRAVKLIRRDGMQKYCTAIRVNKFFLRTRWINTLNQRGVVCMEIGIGEIFVFARTTGTLVTLRIWEKKKTHFPSQTRSRSPNFPYYRLTEMEIPCARIIFYDIIATIM